MRLADHRAALAELGRAGTKQGSTSPPRAAGPIEPSNFRRSFANACAKAKVRKVHVHATRKTCASLLVALDVHPRVAMQILRHSQISVTMNIYSEVSSEETRKALKRLGEQLDS